MKNFSATIALLAIGSSVAAQAATELETQVVTASKNQTRLENMALNTTVITQEDIQKSAAQTLDQLLRDVPGFQFTGIPSTQSDPTGHQTKLRGLGNSKVLVLVDGIPVHDPFYVTTQWFKVPLSNIERVEVVRGGGSSLWGNMAVAGVVSIITKKSVDNSGVAQVSYGSRGSNEIALSKNFSESDALGYNITVEQLNSKGYTLPPSQYAWMYPGRGPVDAKDTNFEFTTYFKPSNDLSGFVKLGYHIQDQDISYQFGNNLQKSPDISAGLTKKLEDGAAVTTNAWSQYVHFEKYNGAACSLISGACQDPAKTTGSGNSLAPSYTSAQISNAQLVQLYSQYGAQRYREAGFSSIYTKNLGGFIKDYQLGMDYRRLSAKDAETIYQTSANGISAANPQVLASSTYGEGVQSFQGLFGQTKLLPIEALEVTLSARLDSYANTDMYTSRTTSANVTSGGARADKSKTSFDPSVSAKYFVDDNLAIRGAAYKAFRAPGFNNLLRTYGVTPTIANPDLEPETLFGKEIGLDYRTEDVYLGATYFDYRINNMIATYTVTSYASAPAVVQNICGVGLSNCNSAGSPKYYTNDQNGASNGYELVGKWKLNSQYTLNASYTFTSTYLTSHGSIVTDPINVQLAGVPKDSATLGLTWNPNSKVRVYGQARYVGRLYIDTTSTAGRPYEQAGNVIYDASASYAWDKNVDVTVSALNLANKEYNEGTYTYNKPWAQTVSLPRTINLGVRVRF
jgi:iron complex outermembrane receptor protein